MIHMFIYGTQYYRPPFPRRNSWRSDLEKIKQSHFNTVKLWAVWSWIERKEGEFYFDDLDEIVRICGEIGLNVVINTIPEGMPYWLSRRHPDAKYQTSDGTTVEMSGAANMPSGGSPGVCPDKAEVQAEIRRFISMVVGRYSKYEQVIAFDVWNEPHLEPIFDYPEQLFCYCEHSKQQFIKWLKKKYSTIDNLNSAWLRAYAGWEDVSPPYRFGTYTDMIDWRLFWIEHLAEWLRLRVSAARTVAQGKSIMTHVPFSGYLGSCADGGLGYHLGDEFVLAPEVDKFGLTSFPKWLMKNDFVQHLVNVELVASASRDKEFWQSELQSGAGKWEAFGRQQATPEEIRLWNWSAVAGGAKGVMYWQWKPEPSGLEALGFGLTSLTGELSPRTETAAECAVAFNTPTGFDLSRPVPVLNGIFVSRTADLWWHAAFKGERLYAQSLYGSYRACVDAGIPVRWIHADHLARFSPEELKVLYVPAPVALSDRELEDLQRFTALGGTLVSECCPGLFDEHGVLRENHTFLEEVFGLAQPNVDHHEIVRMVFPQGKLTSGQPAGFTGRYYRQDFGELKTGVRTLAVFEDGKPGLFEKDYRRGRAIFVGSLVGAAVALSEDRESAKFITRWMIPAGYKMLSNTHLADQVQIRLYQNGPRLYVCAVNYGENAGKAQLTIRGTFHLVDDQTRVRWIQNPPAIELNVEPKQGLIIVLIEGQAARMGEDAL